MCLTSRVSKVNKTRIEWHEMQHMHHGNLFGTWHISIWCWHKCIWYVGGTVRYMAQSIWLSYHIYIQYITDTYLILTIICAKYHINWHSDQMNWWKKIKHSWQDQMYLSVIEWTVSHKMCTRDSWVILHQCVKIDNICTKIEPFCCNIKHKLFNIEQVCAQLNIVTEIMP